MNQEVQEVIDFFGGKQVVAAKKLEISQPHLSNLVRNVEKVSPSLAVKIEQKTNGVFSRAKFLPLLFNS